MLVLVIITGMFSTKKTKRVYRSKWLTVYEDLVQGKNGKLDTFNRIRSHDFVEIVPILKDGSVLMVKNFRYGARAEILELPAGHIEKNEKPRTCAKRELLEETGYTCSSLISKGWLYSWPARSNQKAYVFVARGLEPTFNQSLDDFEYIKIAKVPRNQVARKMRNGQIKNPYAIAALTLAGLRKS
ncbi:MAG: NUDIX hydrolase [Nitrosotalea sp.]